MKKRFQGVAVIGVLCIVWVGAAAADKDQGPTSATCDRHDKASAARHRTPRAGIISWLPACQFLPAISHPRGFQRRSVWLDEFGSGKRILAYLKNASKITVIGLT